MSLPAEMSSGTTDYSYGKMEGCKFNVTAGGATSDLTFRGRLIE